ncbi:MAG: hypothetical protein JSV49_00030, partial [Thermoplasmata archaeon]
TLLLGMNSQIDAVVVYFNQSLVRYLDNESVLLVKNRLTVEVVDAQSLQPLPNAKVDIVDALDASVGTYFTTSEGFVDGLLLNYYQGHDNNSNQNDLDPNERIYYSPYNITVTCNGFITGYANPEPEMNTSRHIVIVLQKIPVEYLVIQNQGGPSGVNVTNSHYPLGATDTFYAAGYHTAFGFVKDISVNWITNDSGIATVITPGKWTTFTASSVHSGPVRITAWTEGISTFVDVYIDTAEIDKIVIQDMDYPHGGWVGSRNYDLGVNQTFYAAGYNNTAGYLGPVHASWSSSNPNVGNVTAAGPSTLFQASSDSYGTTIVTATAINNVNSTGVLTVNPPSVDYITIESLQNGAGKVVTIGAYLVGETDRFYCAGYNNTFGFVKDVSAVWSSTNTGVGTVATAGTFTTFSAVGAGITRVNAAYGGMNYITGDLTVSEQTIIDISIKSIIEPAIPSLDANNISVSAEIENLGNTDLKDVTIDICKNLPDSLDFKSLDSKIIDLLPTVNTVTVKFIFGANTFGAGLHEICILADPMDKFVESDETNNLANFTMKVVTLPDFIVSIEITPSTFTLSADEEVVFTAVGKGRDDQNYELKASWSVSGGGDIDTNGLYTANIVGDWEVYADFGAYQGKATVTVSPGEVKSIEIVEEQTLFAIGDRFQFSVVGYDTDGNLIDLSAMSIIWYVNGAVGEIDTNGLFEAKAAGSGHIGADLQTRDSKLNDELTITVKDKIYIMKNYDVAGTNANYAINVAFTEEGDVTIEELFEENLGDEQITLETFGKYLNHMGIFVKIEIPDTAEWDWIIIECNYKPTDLPPDVVEEDLVMFYFDEALGVWVKCENTWVDTDKNIVYANVTHLTIFAPMADSSGADDQPDTGGETKEDKGLGMGYIMILGLAAIVFVIILAVGLIIIRKRKATSDLEEEYEHEEGEHEMVERELVEGAVDLADLETVTKECPGCKTPIDIALSFDEKVLMECSNCGKKVRILNPYMAEIERISASKQEALESTGDFEPDPDS